jgi:predicted dehydrogenase
VKHKALVIGCGRIGAGYDLDKPGLVWTHAKAYSLIDDLELAVTDIDPGKANEVSIVYHAKVVNESDKEVYKDFDLISISTPTPVHFEYLKKILNYRPPVIICEKPVVNSLKQVDEVLHLYKSSGSKVLVNYMRRFQPAYKVLKERLKKNYRQDSLKEIVIKYKRGFLNNASHAVDLLEYLFDEPFDFKNFHTQKWEFDSFEYDPTLTGTCLYMDQPVSFAGVCDAQYPLFDIEIFYSDAKIVICRSGNEIRYYSMNDGDDLEEDQGKRQTDILDTYMIPVINEALDLVNKKENNDNFMQALMINKRMLEIIEPLKKQNATVSH